MRKRFEQQSSLGLIPISEINIDLKSRDSVAKICLSLLEIFNNATYNEKVFNILEATLMKGKNNTGRNGMDLWQIFVFAQFRLALNLSYDRLHHMANNDRSIRTLLGVESSDFGMHRIEFQYQQILDNVGLLTDEMLHQINEVIVAFGHKEVFKKKEEVALLLKSDSYVVQSNVHFPTDYNLLYDCCRKTLDFVQKFTLKYPQIQGWRKRKDWCRTLKNASRRVGQASSRGGANKEAQLKKETEDYIRKARLLMAKIDQEKRTFPLATTVDLSNLLELEHFLKLAKKHIDLLERRVLKGEIIPHSEKMFSVFETYTEWINKGKRNPNVELGKKMTITTDQYNLIVDYKIMEHQSDREVMIEIADKILAKYSVASWSFDKGYWNKDNKELLETAVNMVVMPKKGKCNKAESEQEHGKDFKKLRNKHSAIESNINELENRGLGRCPDRGYAHFKRYLALGVCAYNLHKIGAQILANRIKEAESQRLRQAA